MEKLRALNPELERLLRQDAAVFNEILSLSRDQFKIFKQDKQDSLRLQDG